MLHELHAHPILQVVRDLRKIGTDVNVRSFDFVPMIDFRDPRLQRLTIDEMDAWLNDSLDLSADEVDEIDHMVAPWRQ